MNVTVVMSNGWEQRIKIEGTPSLHRVVDAVERVVRANVSRHVNTGELLGSVRSVKTVNGGSVWIGTDHWQYIEYGTSPHVINPRVKKALWWRGIPYPVHHVHHPGTPEYAPMRRALNAVRWE